MRAPSRASSLRLRALALAAALAAGLACATSYELVALPEREADVYPHADACGGLAVAVDAIDEPRRVERYFGTDLREEGLLPVLVIVSNHGERRVEVSPADLLLFGDAEVVDPLPLDFVLRAVEARAFRVREETAAELERFYRALAFRGTVVAPGESYQGVLFFDVAPERPESRLDRFFRVARLFPEPALRMHVRVTELEGGERLRFGPFRVEGGGLRGI